MTRVLAVVFDVDGVLVDSLPAHLEICVQLSREYGLELGIPGVDEFRELVRRGVPISPMQEFFRAVGFPEALAQKADREYERSFAERFSPRPFAGVIELLARLQSADIRLGIVSSNTRKNVETALGDLFGLFPSEHVFTREHALAPTKADALRLLVRSLDLPPERIVYVGDQPADARAAREVGVPFIGVSYGWGFEAGMDSPEALSESLLGAR